MTSVPRLSKIMHSLLTDTANTAAQLSGFVQRRSKLTGALFVQTLVFGWLANPKATLEQLTKVATVRGVRLTPQALDQRFTERGAHCLEEVLNVAVQTLVCASPLAAPLLARFAGVYVHDSSVISLPHCLSPMWPGCGNQVVPSSKSAALKLQVRLELSSGTLDGPHLQSGRTHDKHSPHQDMQHAALPIGALRIADLGFFSLRVLRALGKQGVFWLTRIHAHTAVFDEAGQRWELGALLTEQAKQAKLQQAPQLDLLVELGAKARLPCRLVAVKVPTHIAVQRKRKLRQEAKRRGHNLSVQRLRLSEWNIFATNAPSEKLSVQEVLVLGRARWQIELLFKLWKSQGGIDEWRTQNPQRIMCEVYAKLLAMVIQHWLLLVSCWADMWKEGRSMVKAANTVRQCTLLIAAQFSKVRSLNEGILTLQSCIRAGSGCRINKRKAKPHFYQLLTHPSQVSVSQALGPLA